MRFSIPTHHTRLYIIDYYIYTYENIVGVCMVAVGACMVCRCVGVDISVWQTLFFFIFIKK